MQIPYMLNGFHPVVAYREEEIEDDANNNGLINIESLKISNHEDDNDDINNTNV